MFFLFVTNIRDNTKINLYFSKDFDFLKMFLYENKNFLLALLRNAFCHYFCCMRHTCVQLASEIVNNFVPTRKMQCNKSKKRKVVSLVAYKSRKNIMQQVAQIYVHKTISIWPSHQFILELRLYRKIIVCPVAAMKSRCAKLCVFFSPIFFPILGKCKISFRNNTKQKYWSSQLYLERLVI